MSAYVSDNTLERTPSANLTPCAFAADQFQSENQMNASEFAKINLE
jgi:hypothetical protein